MPSLRGVAVLACFVSQFLAQTSHSGIGDYILAGIGSSATNSTLSASTNSSLPTTSKPTSASSTSDSSTSTTTLVVTVTATTSNTSSDSPPTTTALNSSIASTGSGLAYASQCNALSLDWQNSSFALTSSSSVITYIRTITHWTATISTLCDGHPRIIGTLTPVASSTTLANSTITSTPTFTKPPPNCSIAPSDCAALSQAQNNSDSAYQSSLYAVATNVSIATDFSSIVVGSETTKYSFSEGNAPIITLNSSTYSPYLSVTTYGGGSSSSYTYYDITTSGTYTTDYINGSAFTIYGYVPEPAGPAQLGLACSTVTNSAEQCGACTVYGGQVEMQYFPVETSRASRDQCATSPATPAVTTCPLGPLTASYHPGSTGINGHCAEWLSCPYAYANTSTTNGGPYFVSAGNTYYQNRVYVSLDSAYASNSCGPVGGTHSGSVFTLATSQIYSVPFNYSNCAEVGAEFNFANLNPDVPFAAWAEAGSISGCPESDDFNKDGECGDFINGNDDCLALCTTIYDRAYHPNIVVPTQIRNLDPAWGTCVPQLGGVYDPPQALTQALVEAKPTAPGASPTSQPGASAQPAPSPSEQPSPTAAPSPTDGLTTPLAKGTAESSPQSSPDASTPTAEPESRGSATPAQSSQNTPNAQPSASPGPSPSAAEPSPSPESSPLPDPSSSPEQPQSPGQNASPAQSPSAEPAPAPDSQTATPSPEPQQTDADPTNPTLNTEGPGQTRANGDVPASAASNLNSSPAAPSQANLPPSDPAAAQSQKPQSPTEQETPQGSPTAVIFGDSTFAIGSSANEVTVGSQILTAGGPAQTIAGQQISVASNGAIFDGTNTAQQLGATAPAADPTEAATAAAFTFTADGRAYTAALASGQSNAYVVDGSQTIQMGSPTTVNGIPISAASGEFVVGGSNTIPVQTSDPTPPADQDTPPSGDAPVVTVSLVSGETNVAVIDGVTNSFPQTDGLVNGVIYSWNSGNLIVDGSRTVTPGAATTQTLSSDDRTTTSASTTEATSTSSELSSSSSPTRSTATSNTGGSETGQSTPTATSEASETRNSIGTVIIGVMQLIFALWEWDRGR